MTALPRKRSASVAHFGTFTLVIAGLAGLLVAGGWAIAEGYAEAAFLVIVVVGLCILAFAQRGSFIALMLLATMNGLPFIETSRIVFAKYTLQDAAVCALLAITVVWLFLDNRTYRPSRTAKTISHLGTVLLMWWLFTLARSVIGEGVPLQHSAAYGREFLYFALLLMLLPRALLTSRDISALLAILATGVCVYAIGQIMIAVGAGHPGSLIHFEKTLFESGLTRVYAKMTDLVGAALAVSIAAILLAPKRLIRLIASPVAMLLTVSIVVQLTRARWVGLILGLLLVSLWFLFSDQAGVSAILRKRLIFALSVIVIVGLGVIVVAPSILPGATLSHRLLSIFSNIEGSSGTVAVRERASETLTGYLGEHWLFGLGFVPPSFHFYVGLPEGSIRDSDLGVLNAVATMGAVGAVLIYAPALLTLVHCFRRSSIQAHYYWLRYGGAIWIAAALISSVTLVTLFSASGLTLAAVFATILLNPAVTGELVPSRELARRRDASLAGARKQYERPAPTTALLR